jgi:serine/threonine protein kinase, bacterial
VKVGRNWTLLTLACAVASCGGKDDASSTRAPTRWTVSTFAGTGTAGAADGPGTLASFLTPLGIATDATGSVYIADSGNNKVRIATPTGVVTTLAGSGSSGSSDGIGVVASFGFPYGVAVDSGGTIYVADYLNNKIRKVSANGVVATLAGSGATGSADGPGATAQFTTPRGIAVDASGNVYIAENTRIRKVTSAGNVTTLAGSASSGASDGTGSSASFNSATGVAVDGVGNVYVADTGNHIIRKISPTGVVVTFAGSGIPGSTDGPALTASFTLPAGVVTDANGNVFVADTNNNKIRKIAPTGTVTTIAGSGAFGSTDGIGGVASFGQPSAMAISATGALYVTDSGTQTIRKIVGQ